MADFEPRNGYRHVMKTIDDFFQQTYQRMNSRQLFTDSIPIDIQYKGDLYVIEAMLPGIEKKQIHLDVYHHSVRIRVQHTETIEMNSQQVVQREESEEIRERVVSVPFYIEKDQVQATYRNGLLRISIRNKNETIQID